MSFIFFTYRKQRNYTYTCLNISFNLFNYEKISLFDSSIHRHTAGRTVDQLRGFPRTGTDLGAIRPTRRGHRTGSSGSQRRWKIDLPAHLFARFPLCRSDDRQFERHDERLVLHSGRNDRLASRRYQSERFRRRRWSVPHAQQRQQRGDQVHIRQIVLRMDRGLSGMEHEYVLLPLGALPME